MEEFRLFMERCLDNKKSTRNYCRKMPKSKSYSEDSLHQAVAAVRRNRLSISQAARDFSVPKTTIYDHVKDANLKYNKGYGLQLFQKETDGLVEFVLYMAGQGFPLTRRIVRVYVQEILKRSGRKTRFNIATGPSDAWFRRLHDRYPQLGFRKSTTKDRGRARMSNQKVVDEFFTLWSEQLKLHDVTDKPSQVFNCDETGWSGKETSKQKVYGPRRGEIMQQQVITTDHMTAHLCVSGDGRFLPSMIIFKGSKPHSKCEGVPDTWHLTNSESGYMTAELFLRWFKEIFIPHCGRARPVILLMDNHDSHLTLPLIECARANGIVLVGLPSHTTHIMQPLDVHVIGPVKSKVLEVAGDLGFVKPGVTVGKHRLPGIISYSIDRTTAATVKEAFRRSGIMPVNPESIDKSKIVPAIFTETTNKSSKDVNDSNNLVDGTGQEEPSFSATGSNPEESTAGTYLEEDMTSEGMQPIIGKTVMGTGVQTCMTCGQFVKENPLTKKGLLPGYLATILVPPTSAPTRQKRPSKKVVSCGRVISSDEHYKYLKDKEEARRMLEEEKEKRREEREARRAEKKLEEEHKKKRKEERELEKQAREEEKKVKKQRKEAERIQRERERNQEKERARVYGKLADEKYTCGVCNVRGRVNDDALGLQWYGCDNDMCESGPWFHFNCLSIAEQAALDDSISEITPWYCKGCFPRAYREEE